MLRKKQDFLPGKNPFANEAKRMADETENNKLFTMLLERKQKLICMRLIHLTGMILIKIPFEMHTFYSGLLYQLFTRLCGSSKIPSN